MKREILETTLALIKADNAQNELYLTDIAAVGRRQGLRIGVEVGKDPREVIGINTVTELARAENILLGRPGETA